MEATEIRNEPAAPRSWRSRLRALARAARHTPDRWRHAARRRRALASLREHPPASVLFICLGNICRSPYAQAAFQRALSSRPDAATSAGFIGPGRPAPEAALRTASRHGIDLTPHRSRLVDSEAVRSADLVVVMDPRQQRAIGRRFRRSRCLVLGDLDPLPIQTRAIPDPYDRDDAFFDVVYSRIDRCVEVLARSLAEV